MGEKHIFAIFVGLKQINKHKARYIITAPMA